MKLERDFIKGCITYLQIVEGILPSLAVFFRFKPFESVIFSFGRNQLLIVRSNLSTVDPVFEIPKSSET